MSAPLLEVSDLVVAYGRGLSSRADTVAVRGVSFSVDSGKTLGLIGESGSGKSTVLSAIAGLVAPASGRIAFQGEDVHRSHRTPAFRRSVSMLFQSAAVDPRMRVGDIIAEPIRNFERLNPDDERRRVCELLALSGLTEPVADRYPGALSGGQLQRVAIARALALQPRLLLADEPVSALDASVRAQVLDALHALCAKLGIACIFVTHDLGIARHMCDSLCIMRGGLIVERGSPDQVFQQPEQRYTRQLLASVLPIDPAHREAAARRRIEFNA